MKLCPYCHNPLSDADVDQLQSENKMLRELANIGEYAAKECASLAEQNAKLRELARDMWEGYNDPWCEECHLKDTPTCADCPICAREASMIDRMREIGVEL